MERYGISPNFNSTPSQKPTFPSTSPSYISLPPKPHLREAPLRPETPPNIPRVPSRRAEEADISIFAADRYFNEQNPLDDTNPRGSSVSSLEGYRRNSQSTPTATSEASWNSRSGLLTHHHGSVAVVNVRASPRGTVSSPRRHRRGFFGRNCPCSGKKSVDVEENYAAASVPKTPIPATIQSNHREIVSLNANKPRCQEFEEEKPEMANEVVRKLKIVAGSFSREEELVRASGGLFSPRIGRRIINTGAGFSFPVLTPPATDPVLDPARISLEVFRPAEEMPPTPTKSTASMQLAVDGERRSFNSRQVDDDAASDTSSDLFEIESFATQMTPPYCRDEGGLFDARRGIMHFRRDGAEGAATPSIAPSECYPPSEVSVAWSVTTAEGGFDRASVGNFSSAASDYDEIRFIQEEHDRFAASVAGGGGRRRGSGLLTCASEKAVSVGPEAVRLPPEQNRAAAGDRSGIAGSQSARMCGPVKAR